MKIVAISDIHSSSKLLYELSQINGDLLLIAGDLTQLGYDDEMRKVLNKINKLDFRYKIVVLGNHEVNTSYSWCRLNYPNIVFLNNEVIELCGLKIYGTPYSKELYGWAYPYTDDVEDKTIPKEEVDIIISHEPPSDYYLSMSMFSGDIGNKELTKYLQNANVKLVISGHCHECGGGYSEINKAKCYNVARTITQIEI